MAGTDIITASEKPRSDRVWTKRLHKGLIGILVFLTALFYGAYVIVHWSERQILNTDNWVALVSPLPKQPVVSTALGSYVSSKVFDSSKVQKKVTEVLPPKAYFLAGPLTDQLHSLTTKASQKIVASDAFQNIWTSANRVAMNRLLAQARGQPTALKSKLQEKFNLNISAATPQISQAIGNASAAVPALQPAASKAVDVTTNLRLTSQKVQQVIKVLDFLAAVLPFMLLATFLGALAFSSTRRLTAVHMFISIIVIVLLELIAIKVFRQLTLDQVRVPANLTAVGYIYDTLTGWLKHMLYISLGISAVAEVILLVSGPYAWARRFRSLIRLDKLKTSVLETYVQAGRLWVRRWEHYLWLGAFIVVLVFAAFVIGIDAKAILNSILIILILVSAVHILATPPWYKLRHKDMRIIR